MAGNGLNNTQNKFIKALCILAGGQSKEFDNLLCAHGTCIISTNGDILNVMGLGSHGMPNGLHSRNNETLLCHALMNTIVSVGGHQGKLTECSCYYTGEEDACCDECKQMILLSRMPQPKKPCLEEDDSSHIIVDLNKCTWEFAKEYVYSQVEVIETLHPTMKTKFFPLAEDDYFMAVAILSGMLNEKSDDSKGACIVTQKPSRVVSIGYTHTEGDTMICAEKNAIFNAYQSMTDLTKCMLYTSHHPCVECTKVILQTGIRVIVWGKVKNINSDIDEMVYQTKACFIQYQCCIPIPEDKRKFVIDLKTDKVCANELKSKKQDPNADPKPSGANLDSDKGNPKPPGANLDSDKQTLEVPVRRNKPIYRDYFMAMAFLASSRSKNNKTQVGACIVTPYPHRMVMLSYNKMPDGCRFTDEEMDWGPDKERYVCHAEMSAIISAFRRGCDLSSCTLYVTHSPCNHCSKLIAQSGIKNVVFAEDYHNGTDAYNHLERLPGMSVSQYKYREGACGDIIEISLRELKVIIKKSGIDKERDSPQQKDKCQRQIDFPKDDYFMALAILGTLRSDSKEPVGACIVIQEPHRPISVFYRSVPSGRRDFSGIKDDEFEAYESCAEANVILGAFRYHANLSNSTLYTTSRPCPKCAQMIIESGIKTVICGDKFEKHEKPEWKKDQEAVKQLFYRAKIAVLKYRVQTRMPIIKIDLKIKNVEQRDSLEP